MHWVKAPSWLNHLDHPTPIDSITLENHYIFSKSGNRIGVWTTVDPNCETVFIFIHGQLATRAQTHRKLGLALIARNFDACVVTYDPSGYGDSSGWPHADAVKLDAESVVEWTANQHRRNLPIFVWGHSMGGPITAHLGAKFGNCEKLPCVRGVVLESTFAHLSYPVVHGVYGLPFKLIPVSTRNYLLSTALDFALGSSALDAAPLLEAIGKCTGICANVFVLHGDQDWTVPVSAARELEEAFLKYARKFPGFPSIRSIIVQGGHHNDLHTERHSAVVVPAVSKWIADTLNGGNH